VGLFKAPPEGQGGGRLSPRESTTSSANARKNSRKENSPSILIIHSRKEEDRAQLELLKISRFLCRAVGKNDWPPRWLGEPVFIRN
jgi:hypothetical protein